jgi:methyl-accepting chemotaxis protein
VGDPAINVETSELRRFAKDVGFEADEVLAPAVDRATLPLQDGVRFGAKNASGTVHAAKTRYAQALSAHLSNLTEYIEAAKIMAAAAAQVAADFDEVDTRSADASARVGNILRSATDQAQAARLAAERADNPPHGGQAAAV